ncbi:FecR family protein [Mucilaginibacter sp. UYCu711]|uniref:FecR family protein n=1 Tax=Mucilaginibacter sp. UYCu711 TaxID=3156339 RepID=UPI003D1E9D7B
MDERYYRQLIKRYLDGNATDDELEVFAHLVKEGKLDDGLKQALNANAEVNEVDELITIGTAAKRNYKLPFWTKYAAAILLSVAAVVLGTRLLHPKELIAVSPTLKHDALPGGNRAILTLANGKKIRLGSSGNGIIARQGDTRVQKVQDGQLVYQNANSADKTPAEALAYNTINTPKGGQYAVTLPDGSKAWLNSVSSITFPIEFKGNERRVAITGEVYFEVAKNKAMPFIATGSGQNVEVLGTHFNINSYPDERTIKTTLLEGSIKITAEHNTRMLSPGQQADVEGSKITVASGSDTEAAVAWKHGNFVFNNTDLPSLMRQLARWYDVNIHYNGKIHDHEFVGQISRSAKLSSVLKILAVSGVRFTINEKDLYIQP